MIVSNTQHLNRHRADSGGNRTRSDSQETADTYNSYDPTVRHPVEPRARTALLPPIMVPPTPSSLFRKFQQG